jgi:hypothetical protein
MGSYRRRRPPAGAIFRARIEHRPAPPGSRIIGTLLASGGRLADPSHHQESGRV